MIRPATHDRSPLSDLAPQLASTIASVTSDVALIIGDDGVIRSVARGEGDALAAADAWEGRLWADTVVGASRRKIEQLLQEALEVGVARRREVNLTAGSAADIPIAYSAVRLGSRGPVLAVGRDLREVAAMQLRFIAAQNEMERDYWRQRQSELRYRTLFEVATDAVFVVDAETLCIVDANGAAVRLYDLAPDQLAGKRITVGLDRASRAPVEQMLGASSATGRPRQMRARLAGRRATTRLSATPFRSEGRLLLLVRAAAIDPADDADEADEAATQFVALVQRTPDSIVVCDAMGRVRIANAAFVRLTGAQREAELRGASLEQWLKPDFGNFNHLLLQVRRHGIVRAARATLVDRSAGSNAVELSAMLLPGDDEPAVGLVLRRLDSAHPAVLTAHLAGAIAHVSAQLGLAPLPTLMHELAQLTERHLLVAALEHSGGDHTAAADLLDVSADDFDARLRARPLDDDCPAA
jgi:transcriptional regulator PpsR